MNLYSATTRHLSAGLLTRLAQASALPEAEAQSYTDAALEVLVRQLAQPTDPDELNARWDMCRQLYLSQLLTDREELLRTDLGWPDRRRYLAEKILGATQVTELGVSTQNPASATTLLGYLTILTLAVVGEHASQSNLEPAAMGQWLAQQTPPKPAAPSAPTLRASQATASAKPTPAPAPRKAGRQVKLAAIAGGLILLSVGGYVVVGKSSDAPTAPPTPTEAPAAPAPVVETTATVAPLAPAAAEAAAPAAKPAAAPKVATAAAAGPMLRDTLGNAAMARAIGGRFSMAQGRYPKGEGQPLTIKLVERATLTVGINSTESLLYKYLSTPALPQASDLVLDRLAFDNSRASLGAEGAQQLSSVASLLKTFPKARVLVLGHANPSEEDATKLGLKRATAAVEELQKRGINPGRLQAQGVLATGSPTDNDSAERQAMLQGISLKISRL